MYYQRTPSLTEYLLAFNYDLLFQGDSLNSSQVIKHRYFKSQHPTQPKPRLPLLLLPPSRSPTHNLPKEAPHILDPHIRKRHSRKIPSKPVARKPHHVSSALYPGARLVSNFSSDLHAMVIWHGRGHSPSSETRPSSDPATAAYPTRSPQSGRLSSGR